MSQHQHVPTPQEKQRVVSQCQWMLLAGCCVLAIFGHFFVAGVVCMFSAGASAGMMIKAWIDKPSGKHIG